MPSKYSKTPILDAAPFWERVQKSDGCWLWIGPTHSPGGYGQFNNKRTRCYAHIASWILANGPIPDGLFVLHECDNPRCVRPGHLFLGTQGDNVRDMLSKGRGIMQTHPEIAVRGDEHPARKHPGIVRRGESHHAKQRPECMARGERCASAKLTADVVREIRRLYREGIGYDRLARRYGIAKSSVAAVVNLRTWRHVA